MNTRQLSSPPYLSCSPVRERLQDVVCLDGVVYMSSLRLHVVDNRGPFLHSPRPPPTS